MYKYLIRQNNKIYLVKYCIDNTGLWHNKIFNFNSNEVICEIPDDFIHFWRYVKSGQYQMFLIDNPECDKEDIHEIYRMVFMSSHKSDSYKTNYYPCAIVGLHGLYIEYANKPFGLTYIAPKSGYNEWRGISSIKWYEQTKTVNYAPYKVNHWYCDVYDYYGMEKPNWSEILW